MLGQTAILSVSVECPDNRTVNLPPPTLPSDLEIRRALEPTTSISLGARTVYGVIHRWEVAPLREGRIEIPPLTFEVDGTRLTTDTLALNVMPSPLHDLVHGHPLAQPVSATPGRRILAYGQEAYDQHAAAFRDRLYLLACADTAQPHVGQQVNVSVYLINGAGIILSQPEFDRPLRPGSLSFDLYNAPDSASASLFPTFTPLEEEDYLTAEDPLGGDSRVLACLLRRVAIFPPQAGEISLGALQAHSAYLYNYQGQQRLNDVVFTTAPLTLHVQPLPGSQTPTASVPVGRHFRISAELTPTRLAYDEAASLTVRVEGEGLPERFGPPVIDGGDMFRAEPPPTWPEPQVMELRGDRLWGVREFTYLVRFNRTGPLTLPPITYPVFDLDTASTVSLQTQALEVQVSPQASEAPREITSTGRTSPPAATPVNRDVLFEIETRGFRGLRSPPPLATGTAAGWLLIVVPPGVFALAAWTRLRQQRLSGQEGFTRRARRRALRHLRAAERARRQGDAEAFHAELAAAVHGHLTERLGRPTLGLSWIEVDQALAERGVDQALRDRIGHALSQTDFARFAPGVDPAAAMDQLHRDTLAALQELGRQLPLRRRDGR